jgi:hypothetical protein
MKTTRFTGSIMLTVVLLMAYVNWYAAHDIRYTLESRKAAQ